MKTIGLSNSPKLVMIDDDDYVSLLPYTWHLRVNDHGHISVWAQIGINQVSLARFILQDFSSQVIDHIDRNSLNNQKNNLRPTTHKINTQNRGIASNNTSGYKGVTFRKDMGVWAACIRVNNKNKHLGFFVTKENAARTYNEAALKYFGPHAYLNKVQ